MKLCKAWSRAFLRLPSKSRRRQICVSAAPGRTVTSIHRIREVFVWLIDSQYEPEAGAGDT
jgi:hypothetical protein